MSTTAIALPARNDRAAAEQLLTELVARLDADATGPIVIDGIAVEQIGQAMLQVLLSLRRSASGTTLSASPALRETALLCGLSEQLFDDPQP